MLTSLRLKRGSALIRISKRPTTFLLSSINGSDRTAGESSSYSSLFYTQDSRRLTTGKNHVVFAPPTLNAQRFGGSLILPPMARASFSSEAEKESATPSEIVVELYEEMLNSVDKVRTMPPNAKLWSLVENSSNPADIKLLFQILQKLHIFRLSNLRIHANFNDHLCMKVSEACARANVPEDGLKALWNHNVYGLTPNMGSAHYLLLHAKEKNDVKLLVKIMEVMKKNSLPLLPRTADIVFSICYNANDWSLITKYSRTFLKAGVDFHRSAFDIWMEFAAKRGDSKSIWKIERLRSKAVKTHTLASGFSCAKGYLIERKPESAAAIINVLYQDLPDQKKALIPDELHKLTFEWPRKLVKRQKKEDREELAESLKSDISAMAASLLNMGVDAKLTVEELTY